MELVVDPGGLFGKARTIQSQLLPGKLHGLDTARKAPGSRGMPVWGQGLGPTWVEFRAWSGGRVQRGIRMRAQIVSKVRDIEGLGTGLERLGLEPTICVRASE